MLYREIDLYDESTYRCPICGEEGACVNPDACHDALEELRSILDDAPPDDPADDFPQSTTAADDPPF